MNRRIWGCALGTYYVPKAYAGEAGRIPGANAMRSLFYRVKNNRPLPLPPERIRHEDIGDITVTVENAMTVCRDIAQERWKTVAALLQINGEPIALVPIPSSTATAANWRTTRFPTWALAQALGQAVHPSVVTVCIVQKHERPSKLKQGRDARVTASGLTSIASIPTSHRIVLVDDLVTTGSSVIAMDRLLDNRVHGVITVGVNDTSSCVHAATLRGFTIEYDAAAPQLPSRPSLVLAN